MKDQLLDFTGLTELVNQMKGYTSDITSSIHLTGGNSNGTLGLDINGTVHYASVKGLSSAAYKATGSASGNIPVNGASLGSTANVPLVTNSNGQIVPHANGILGTAAFKNATEFATAAQGAKAETAVQSVSLESGTNKGTLKLTVNGKASDNIAVKGLGTAAYTASSAYATSSQGTKADNAMPRTGGTFTGSVTLNGDPSSPFHPATKQYVDSHIADGIAASDAMVFRGTLGTDGTVTALPDKAIMGDTYKVITVTSIPAANSYTGSAVSVKVGDLIVAMSAVPVWLVVPSGDETVTTVKYSTTTQNLTTSAKSGSIVLGEAATKQVDSAISASSTSAKLPTSQAVADFVEGKGYSLTDQKVRNELAQTTKAYITGTTSTTTTIGEQIFDTGVYLDTVAGQLVAATFKGNLAGNATTSSSCTGNSKTATNLATSRTFSITGGATANSVSFNGSGNVALTVSALNADYLINGSKTLVLSCGTA